MLVPGNYVDVLIGRENSVRLTIPQSALGQDIGGIYAMVINDESIAEQRYLELGDVVDGGARIVLGGVKAGEQVVVQGLQKVSNGQQVKVTSVMESSKCFQNSHKPSSLCDCHFNCAGLAGLICPLCFTIALYPSINPPEIVVSASYPGASADVWQKRWAFHLKKQSNGVEDMLYMSFFFARWKLFSYCHF